VPDVHDHDQAVEPSRVYGWITGALYLALIGANLYLVFDWWRDTPEGSATLARWRAKAAECEGCAKRRAALKGAINRMHWQAERIIEGEDVDTQPEAPAE
jgi:hypothetical protein